MTKEFHRLAFLFELLSEEATPSTPDELLNRILVIGWANSEGFLKELLRSDNSDVVRLTLNVLARHAELFGTQSTRFAKEVTAAITHPDRLVRATAVNVAFALLLDDGEMIDVLTKCVLEDELTIAKQALLVLIELEDEFANKVIRLIRTESKA